jgi:hypothetical protein
MTKLLALLFLFPLSANALNWGVNVHSIAKLNANLAMLKERGFTHVRMDIPYNIDRVALKAAAQKAKDAGISITGVLFSKYQWTTDCTVSRTVVEQTAYSEAYAVVNELKDLITDWELQNEVDLTQNCKMQVTGTTGRLPSHWATSNGTFHAANLRGISRAIGAVKSSNGTPLSSILNFTTMHIGFVDFMVSQNVVFSKVSYHIYEREAYSPYNYGIDPASGWNLFGAVMKWNKPVHINEFNAGEIYDAGYCNKDGDAMTEKGFRSMRNLMDFWTNAVATVKTKYGKDLKLETVDAYEIQDNPNNGNSYSCLAKDAEARFGLLYADGTPKTSMLLAAAYAGGKLSDAEVNKLVSKGLLTVDKIMSMQKVKPLPLVVTYPTTSFELRNKTALTITPTIAGGMGLRKCSAIGLPAGLNDRCQRLVSSLEHLRSLIRIPLKGVTSEATVTVGQTGAVTKLSFAIYPACECGG